MAEIKQYVNLDPSKAAQLDGLDQARAGRNVVFEAKINRKKAGISIRFKVTRGAENVTRARDFTYHLAVTDGSGKAVLPFELSADGGDTFTFTAAVATDGSKTLSTDTYVVWRRLYYQMSRFQSGVPGEGQPGGSLPAVPAFDLADVITELEARNHNIELVDKSKKAVIKRHANLITRDNDSADLKSAGLDSYDATLAPVTLRIVVANQIGDPRTNFYLESDLANGGKPLIDVPDTFFKDPTCDKDQDWLVKAEWKLHGDPDLQPLDARWVTRTGDSQAQVDLASAALGGVEGQGRNVDIKLTYRYPSGGCGGTSAYNMVCLATKTVEGVARTAAEISETAIHEIGHFLGMVPPAQATHYTLHGHNGPHCNTGVRESRIDWLDYRGEDGTCIMFGENGGSRTSTFCEACDPSVRKSTVQREGMPKNPRDWWR